MTEQVSLSHLNHTSEKKKKLTLATYNCQKDKCKFDMNGFVCKRFSMMKLYDHIELYFTPPSETNIEVGQIFCQQVANKESKVSSFN